MPQLSRLIFLFSAFALSAATAVRGQAPAQNRHFRAGNLTKPCTPCHAGHGVSRTPLLKTVGDQLCLGCHSSASASPAARAQLGISSTARPADIRSEMTKAYAHGQARCLDCHSAHFGSGSGAAAVAGLGVGIVRPSTRRGFRSEVELCLSCHGSRGPQGQDTKDLSARFLATNPSYHPVLAQSRSRSASTVKASLTSAVLLSCTDCHGSDAPNGPRGPHGSRNRGLLAQEYAIQDGQMESATAYALCYACHDRATILGKDSFPEHAKHVVGSKTPCGLCHDPHGTTSARALIRFNEATPLTGVTPSRSGKLQFLSTGPGSGSCYLTCHGKDHDPLSYGPGATGLPPPAVVDKGVAAPARALGGLPGPHGTTRSGPRTGGPRDGIGKGPVVEPRSPDGAPGPTH